MYKVKKVKEEEYKEIIYSGDVKHKLRIWIKYNDEDNFGIELLDVDEYCEKLTVKSRIIPNGAKTISLNNFVSKEAELILHDLTDLDNYRGKIKINLCTLVSDEESETEEYEEVPIGIFNVQDLPTTDNGKTTIKLRDNSVLFDSPYNAKKIIEDNGGSISKKALLDDICLQSHVENGVKTFANEMNEIGIYDNSITGRQYVAWLAEQAGCIATIDRLGKLIFIDLNSEESDLLLSNNYIYIQDATSSNAIEYNIEGKSEQDAEPSPDFPSDIKTVKGITNLIGIDNFTTTYMGVTITYENGIFTLNGTGLQNNVYQINSKDDISLKGDYTLSNFYLDGDISREVDTNFNVRTSSGNFLWKIVLGKHNNYANYNIASDTKIKFGINIEKDTTYTNFRFRPMLIESSDINSYVPYGTWLKSKVTGKNLFNLGAKNFSVANTQIYIKNSEMSINGTFSSNGDLFKPVSDKSNSIKLGSFKSGTYTFSSLLKSGSVTKNGTGSYTFYIRSLNDDGSIKHEYVTFSDVSNFNYNKTFTLTEDIDLYVRIYINAANVFTFNNCNIEFQLEQGTETTGYEPYKENEVLVDFNKPNLFDKDYPNIINGYVDNTSHELVTSSISKGIYVNVKPNTEYTIEKTLSERFGVDTFVEEPQIGSIATNHKLNNEVTKIVIRTGENDHYLFVRYFYNNSSNEQQILDSIKIYEGYSPYHELCSIGDTKDNLKVVSGTLTKKIEKIIIDENSYIQKRNDGNGSTSISFNLVDLYKKVLGSGTNYIMCSHFKYNQSSTNGQEGIGISTNASGEMQDAYIQILRSRLETIDVDGFKKWLKDNPITIYYIPKEEPQPVLLEPTNVHLFDGENHITLEEDIDTVTSIKYHEKKHGYSIPIEIVEKYSNNVEYEIKKVEYEDAIRKYDGEDKEDVSDKSYSTLYLDTANPYISSQQQVDNMYEKLKGFKINSYNTGKIIGNPCIDPWDIISIKDYDDTIFNTLATNDMVYNGVIIQEFDTPIELETRQSNVTINSEPTFRKWARTEIDNVNAEITLQAGQIEQNGRTIEETNTNLENNYYQKSKVEQLILNASSGLTNTFSEAGGNNILKNTSFSAKQVLEEGQYYEYWYGYVTRELSNYSANGYSIRLQNNNLYQLADVANGNYTLSFSYKKLNPLANVSVEINEREYELTETGSFTQFQTGAKNLDDSYITQPIVVVDNHIKVEFKSDTANSCEIYDIMLNAGSVKLAYSQNQNETLTDTVNIGRGISIKSNISDVEFSADNEKMGFKDNSGNYITQFTSRGMNTTEAIIKNEAEIVGILRQKVGDQIWDCML